MRKCESCGRESPSGEPVECDEPSCPLGTLAPDDPTFMDGQASRAELIAAAMAAREGGDAAAEEPEIEPTKDVSSDLVRKLEEDIKAGRDFVQEDKLSSLRARLKKTLAKKKAAARALEEKASSAPSTETAEEAQPPEDEAYDSTVIDPDFDLEAVPVPDSIESEPADDEAAASADDEHEAAADDELASDDEAASDDDAASDEEAAAEDEAVAEPVHELDLDDLEELVADVPEEVGEDRTVEASKPDLDAIREAAAAAAREMQADEAARREEEDTELSLAEQRAEKKRISVEYVSLTGEFEARDAELLDMSQDDLPILDDVEMSQKVVLREDPNFGKAPYEVVEPPASGYATDRGEADGLGIGDVVDVDAWRDVLVLLAAIAGCGLVAYLAVGGWWSPMSVMVGTFGVVVGTCAILGLLLLPSDRGSEWRRIAARSAGMAGPFALLVTLAWASGDVRASVFDRIQDGAGVGVLQEALSDPSDAVASRACRVLAHEQLHHGSVLAKLDERPDLAGFCMEESDDKEHRIAVSKLSEIWRARLNAPDASDTTCDYADPYAQLPISEEQKFYDFFHCAFDAADPGLKKCCGETLRQTYGTGADLVPGVQLVALGRLDAATMGTVVGPILHRRSLDQAGTQNAVALEFDDDRLERVALETACILLETEAAPTVIEHLSAYASSQCQDKAAGATRRFDDWQQVCMDLAGPRPTAVTNRDALCFSLGTLDIARAVGEAGVLVHAAIARQASHALEEGIEVGKVREAAAKLASREERMEEMVIEEIHSRYDVHSKQASLKALDSMAKTREKHARETEQSAKRWNSARFKQAKARRKNIMRILMKHDKSWETKVKEQSGR